VSFEAGFHYHRSSIATAVPTPWCSSARGAAGTRRRRPTAPVKGLNGPSDCARCAAHSSPPTLSAMSTRTGAVMWRGSDRPGMSCAALTRPGHRRTTVGGRSGRRGLRNHQRHLPGGG
jgi:hypothetical protein